MSFDRLKVSTRLSLAFGLLLVLLFPQLALWLPGLMK